MRRALWTSSPHQPLKRALSTSPWDYQRLQSPLDAKPAIDHCTIPVIASSAGPRIPGEVWLSTQPHPLQEEEFVDILLKRPDWSTSDPSASSASTAERKFDWTDPSSIPRIQFGGSSPQPPPNRKPSKDDKLTREQRFQLQLGKALDTLREDLPHMFSLPQDLSIYSEDLVVSDMEGRAFMKGKPLFRTCLSTLRVANKLTHFESRLHVHSIRYEESRSEIAVRFSIRSNRPDDDASSYYEAIAIYKLNAKGLINELRIDHVTRQNIFSPRALIRGIHLPGMPWACPDPLCTK